MVLVIQMIILERIKEYLILVDSIKGEGSKK